MLPNSRPRLRIQGYKNAALHTVQGRRWLLFGSKTSWSYVAYCIRRMVVNTSAQMALPSTISTTRTLALTGKSQMAPVINGMPPITHGMYVYPRAVCRSFLYLYTLLNSREQSIDLCIMYRYMHRYLYVRHRYVLYYLNLFFFTCAYI